MTDNTTDIPLLSLKKGSKARITGIENSDNATRLMLSHGLRVGSVIDILHQRKRGVVIANGASRIALGLDMARKLHVQSIS